MFLDYVDADGNLENAQGNQVNIKDKIYFTKAIAGTSYVADPEVRNKDNTIAVSEEVAASSEEISTSSQEMNASTEEVALAAQSLNNMTDDMMQEVNKFKLLYAKIKKVSQYDEKLNYITNDSTI